MSKEFDTENFRKLKIEKDPRDELDTSLDPSIDDYID